MQFKAGLRAAFNRLYVLQRIELSPENQQLFDVMMKPLEKSSAKGLLLPYDVSVVNHWAKTLKKAIKARILKQYKENSTSHELFNPLRLKFEKPNSPDPDEILILLDDTDTFEHHGWNTARQRERERDRSEFHAYRKQGVYKTEQFQLSVAMYLVSLWAIGLITLFRLPANEWFALTAISQGILGGLMMARYQAYVNWRADFAIWRQEVGERWARAYEEVRSRMYPADTRIP
jgi:hypothetical protein